MAAQTHQAGGSGSESSETTGASFNASHEGTQQQPRHQAVHCEAANVATKKMSQDAHLKFFRESGSSTNITQHTIRCEYIHIMVYRHQLI